MVQAFFRRRQQRRDSKPSCHFHLQYCWSLVILRSGFQSSMSRTGQSNLNVPFLYREFPVQACSADFDNSTTFFCLRRACLHHTQAHQGLRNPVTNVRMRGVSPSIDHVFVSCCLIKHTYFVFFLHNPTWRVCVLYQLWYIRLTDSSIIAKKNVWARETASNSFVNRFVMPLTCRTDRQTDRRVRSHPFIPSDLHKSLQFSEF